MHRGRALGLAITASGLVLSGLFLAYRYMPGPKGESEPNLAGMYGVFAKLILPTLAWPLPLMFVAGFLIVQVLAAPDGTEETVRAAQDLPRAKALSEARDRPR